MTEPDINVSVEDVRLALNAIDADKIPSDVIEAAIKSEETVVRAMLPEDWVAFYEGEGLDQQAVEDLLDVYVARRAAREAFNNSPMVARKQALDAVISYDVQSFRGRLRGRIEDIEEILFPDRGATSAPFVDVSSSGSGRSIHERLKELTKYPGAFRR